MRRPRQSNALLFSILLAACGGEDGGVEPEDVLVTGEWVGAGGTGNGMFNIELTMTESAGAVTGTGRFRVGSQTVSAFTITGTHLHPQVTLTIVASGFEDALFSGSFSNANTIGGVLNGSGFVDEAMMITRRSSP